MAETEQPTAGLTPESALHRVIMSALYRDKLAKGLHEACKAIESRKAKVAVLAKDCSEQKYKDLIQALCKENDIPLMLVENGTTIGEWIGLTKTNKDTKAKVSRRCSCVVLKDYPFEDEAAKTLQDHLKKAR
jgi:small subunit ribosomal protein S12e